MGNPAHTRLLKKLKPSKWFSAHLHIRYTANVDNAAESTHLTKAKDDQTSNVTQFLALDKCLPNRPFLEVKYLKDRSLIAITHVGLSRLLISLIHQAILLKVLHMIWNGLQLLVPCNLTCHFVLKLFLCLVMPICKSRDQEMRFVYI